MQILQTFAGLFSNFGNLTWQMVVMWVIGGLLIYLAIVKKMEPSLLLPMGFGAILVNLPLSGAITQGDTVGPISALFEAGMSNELFPLLLFIGIGAMIDFGPLLEKPWLMLFGAAAQFGIFITLVLAGLVAPASVALVGFLMFGNLLRECGVLNALSETAQNVLANLITIVLGLTVAGQMTADKFVQPDTLLILALGLVAFVFDTVGGVLFAKLLNLFLPEGKKINPMIGAAGITAFPMSGRVVNQMGLAEDNQNFLLMYSISVNVSGQIASVIAGGLILTLMNGYV